jgi:tRNA pseudouridine55 synthase
MTDIAGFLLVDKPAGITSHDVVDQLRKLSGIRKIGHAGTLDPFATGLLILAISRKATREISHFVKKEKEYIATFVLGATSDTLDKDGVLQLSEEQKSFTKDQIIDAIKPLTGMIEQIPPMYSALKIKGKKLYELAREGKTVERQPRPITIHTFELLDEPVETDGLTRFQVRIRCSSGTYIRVLAQDLATNLGTLGYVEELRRTEIAPYRIEEATRLEDLTSTNWTEKLIDVPEGGMLP